MNKGRFCPGLLGVLVLWSCLFVGRAEALGEREAQVVNVLATNLVEVLVDGVVKPMILEGLGLPVDIRDDEAEEGRLYLLSRLKGRIVYLQPVVADDDDVLRGYLWLERSEPKHKRKSEREYLLRSSVQAILLSRGYAFLLDRNDDNWQNFVVFEHEAKGQKLGWWKKHGHGKPKKSDWCEGTQGNHKEKHKGKHK